MNIMSDWFDDIPIDFPKGKNLQRWQIRGIGFAVVIVLLLILILSFKPWFTVEPDEVGVVIRLGKYNRLVDPGFHWRLPRPIEMVYTPKVQQVKRIEVGFQTISTGPPAKYRNIKKESQMLTGDENVVMAELSIQYRISDPIKYLFNVAKVENTLKDITESVERQVIGDYAIDAALTWGRDEIQNQIKEKIQEVCNQYEMGVQIGLVQLQDTYPPAPVEPAFLAVWSAREDQSRFVNEAEGYRNSEIPKAEGKVQQIIQEAEAFEAERVAKAKGEVERFSALLNEYRKAPDVLRARLYLETLEKVLPGKSKVILEADQDVFKFLNLNSGGIGPVFSNKAKTGEEARQ